MSNQISSENSSNCYYCFYILIKLGKELANNFEGKFYYLGKNPEKYKTLSVPIEEKVTNVDKYANESIVTISSKI